MLTNAQEDVLISALIWDGAVAGRANVVRKLEHYGFVHGGTLTSKGRERAEFLKASREALRKALG